MNLDHPEYRQFLELLADIILRKMRSSPPHAAYQQSASTLVRHDAGRGQASSRLPESMEGATLPDGAVHQ